MTRATLVCGSALVALGTLFLAACSSEPPAADTQPTTSAAADTQETKAPAEQALLEDLTVANRILARELDILDIQGHVTARSRAI